MSKTQITPNRPIYPTPAALITSVDAAGRPNIITLGEVFNISIRQPVILGIATRKATYSHTLISQTREYGARQIEARVNLQLKLRFDLARPYFRMRESEGI